MCVFYYRKSVGIESRISLCAIRNKVSVDVFLWFCQCQSGFTVFVTKLLIRQFTLLIYIFTNHYSHYSPLNRVLQILCTYFCKSVYNWLPKKKQLNKVSQSIITLYHLSNILSSESNQVVGTNLLEISYFLEESVQQLKWFPLRFFMVSTSGQT